MGSHTYNGESDDITRSNVEKYGLSVVIVQATAYLPSFAYSIGLWKKYNHPEIICFGFSNNTLHQIINDVADQVKSGSPISTKKSYSDFFENNDVMFVCVHSTYLSNYFGAAIEYYNSQDFPVLQLVWTDGNNKFPWQESFQEEFIYKQPLLDRNIEFKFREAKNLAIFTTKQWLNKNKPIVRVVHENDADWQFLTSDQTAADICIVALEQMVVKDITLNEIFDLDYGEYATRNFIGDNWERGVLLIDSDETGEVV